MLAMTEESLELAGDGIIMLLQIPENLLSKVDDFRCFPDRES